MLKRLFLSLLILSTLTSEGMANFPRNLYCYYFNNVNELGVLKDQKIAQTQLEEANKINVLKSNTLFCATFVLTSNSVQKFDSKAACDTSYYERAYNTIYTIEKREYISLLKYDHGIFLDKSGTSPPFLI